MSKKENTSRIRMISTRAKQIYNKPGNKLKWTEAIKKASNQLKSEGKL